MELLVLLSRKRVSLVVGDGDSNGDSNMSALGDQPQQVVHIGFLEGAVVVGFKLDDGGGQAIAGVHETAVVPARLEDGHQRCASATTAPDCDSITSVGGPSNVGSIM